MAGWGEKLKKIGSAGKAAKGFAKDEFEKLKEKYRKKEPKKEESRPVQTTLEGGVAAEQPKEGEKTGEGEKKGFFSKLKGKITKDSVKGGIKGGLGKIKGGVFRKRCSNPRCGWVGQTPENACPKCGSALTTETTTWRKGPIGYTVSFFMYFGVLILLMLYGPLSVILNLASNLIQEALSVYAPGWIGAAYIPYIAAGFLGLVAAVLLNTLGLKWGILALIFIVLGVGFGPSLLLLFPSPGGALGGQWDIFMCIMTTGDFLSCQQTVNATATPDAEKVEGYKPLDMRFGTEITTPPYKLSTIFYQSDDGTVRLKKYIFTITLRNQYEDKDIGVLDLWGVIKNATNGVVATLSAKPEPTEENPLVIGPKETILLMLESVGEESTPKVKYPRFSVEINVTYSYSVVGTNTLLLVRSPDDIKFIPKVKPKTGSGPIDAVLWFVPQPYLLEYKTRGIPEILAFISLQNRGYGIKSEGWITYIALNPLLKEGASYPIMFNTDEDKRCTTPWGDRWGETGPLQEMSGPERGCCQAIAACIMTTETNCDKSRYGWFPDRVCADSISCTEPTGETKIQYLETYDTLKIGEEHQYICSYDVTVDAIDNAYETIPFSVNVNYTYMESIGQQLPAAELPSIGVTTSTTTTISTITTTSIPEGPKIK